MMGVGNPHTMPSLYVIAGPNGAGKTTLIKRFAPRHLALLDFLNADEIARDSPALAQLEAGRLMLKSNPVNPTNSENPVILFRQDFQDSLDLRDGGQAGRCRLNSHLVNPINPENPVSLFGQDYQDYQDSLDLRDEVLGKGGHLIYRIR